MNHTAFHTTFKTLQDAQRILVDAWLYAAQGDNEKSEIYLAMCGFALAKATYALNTVTIEDPHSGQGQS